MSEQFTPKQVKRTEPVSTVIELEARYRTRYVAWIGILLLWSGSLGAIVWRGAAPEWLLFAALSLVCLSSGLLPVFAAYKLNYNRTISTSTVKEGQLQVDIMLTRALPVPSVWYSVNDQLLNSSTMRGEKIKLRASFMPLFHRKMSMSFAIKDLERGNYVSKPTIINIIDWLGLTCIKLELENAASFIVLPQYHEPTEESYVARNTSSKWLKANSNTIKPVLLHTSQSLLDNEGDGQLGKSNSKQEGSSFTIRPYVAGDNYRRLDSRAAARGIGWYTKLAETEDSPPKLCFLLDQYDLPYEESQQDQLFHSLIDWCLADTIHAGAKQNVSILSDNWSFEYRSSEHNEELKTLLALTRPDVTLKMRERVDFFAPLFPSNGHIVVYSGAWKDSDGWIALAEAARLKGSSVELQFVTTNRVMTYAMREQQKVLETAGIPIVWRYSSEKPATIIEVAQGSEQYATAT